MDRARPLPLVLSLLLALPLVLSLGLSGCVSGCGSGCSSGERGHKRIGERCGSDSECRRGLCVEGVAPGGPVCTKSCGSSEQCPSRWSCSGVTEGGVLVCSQRSATPFDLPNGARPPRPAQQPSQETAPSPSSP